MLFYLFCCAVTEEEVYRGVLSQPDAKDHCLCFERTLVDIDLKHPKVSRFVELEKPGKSFNDNNYPDYSRGVNTSESSVYLVWRN